MADSDEDYVGEISDRDLNDSLQRGGAGAAAGTRSRRKKQRGGAEWEVSRTWETLVEGVDGTLTSAVEGLLEAGKRKR